MADPSPANSEWLTRKRLIDQRLDSARWRVTPFVPETKLGDWDRCAVEEFPTTNGPADYALVMDGRVVGVVEAKKLSLGPQNVLSQAQRYARGRNDFAFGEYGVPFLARIKATANVAARPVRRNRREHVGA